MKPPMTDGPRPLRGSTLVDAALVCAGFLALYLLLGQDTFYKADGQHLVRRLVQRDPHYPHHRLYMPLLIGFSDLVAPLGLTPYRTATLFSAVGVAVGCGLTRIGFAALGASRAAALWMTLLVGLCPAPLLFATVVEFHGPFFAFAALAFVEAAFLCRRPGVAGAVFLGAFCAVAAGVHASGIVLPALLLPWFLALRAPCRTLARDLGLAGIAAGTAAVLLHFLAAPARAEAFLDRGFGHPQGVGYLPAVVRDEWLLAYLPLSVTVLAAFFRKGTRLQAVAFAAGTSPYLYGALRLLAGDREWGAYLLPLAIPAAWLTVRALPRRPLPFVLVLIAAGLSIPQVLRHDRASAGYRRYAAGMREATGNRPALLLLGAGLEVGACLVYLPRTQIYLLDEVANLPPETLRRLLPEFDRIVRTQQDDGRDVFLTEGGRRYLVAAGTRLTGAARILLAHIEATYHLEEVRAPGFRAWRLARR